MSDELERDYLLLFLKSSAGLRQMERRMTGGLYPAIVQDELEKIRVPIPKARAAIYVERYFLWPVVSPAPSTVLRALEIERRYQISFWDAMILSAALQAGVRKLVSEDLNAGHTIEGIRIENPFA